MSTMFSLFRRPWVLGVVLLAVALVVVGLLFPGVNEWMNDHQVVAAFAVEALLLAGVYLIVEHEITRRQWARSAEVSRAVVAQLDRSAVGVRTVFAVKLITRTVNIGPPTAGFELARHDEKLVAALPAMLAEEADRFEANRGLDPLHDAVDDALAALGTAFNTWAPGVVGRSALDPVLNHVARLIETGSQLSLRIREGMGLEWRFETLEPGDDASPDAVTERARQEAAVALRQYLETYREFDAERRRYLGTLDAGRSEQRSAA